MSFATSPVHLLQEAPATSSKKAEWPAFPDFDQAAEPPMAHLCVRAMCRVSGHVRGGARGSVAGMTACRPGGSRERGHRRVLAGGPRDCRSRSGCARRHRSPCLRVCGPACAPEGGAAIVLSGMLPVFPARGPQSLPPWHAQVSKLGPCSTGPYDPDQLQHPRRPGQLRFQGSRRKRGAPSGAVRRMLPKAGRLYAILR
jgi:hypothetical protein